MTCDVRVIDGRRVVCFDAPAAPVPPDGYKLDGYQVDAPKVASHDTADLDEAARVLGDYGVERAALYAYAVPATPSDRPDQVCEWSNGRGAWGAWEDA
jgi:hypothetical protein